MMTSSDYRQVAGECSLWREQLRSLRNILNQHQGMLRQTATKHATQDELLQLEHLHNQLHIQLINIHDLKHEVKKHQGRVSIEMENMHRLSDHSLAKHDWLEEQISMLHRTIDAVVVDLNSFMAADVV